jgi:hypothetical protein
MFQRVLVVAVVVVMCVMSVAQGVRYWDVADDFYLGTQPQKNWQYGYKEGVRGETTPFTRFTVAQSGYWQNFDVWLDAGGDTGAFGMIAHCPLSRGTFDLDFWGSWSTFAEGATVIAPPPSFVNQKAITYRFTAPQAGTYHFATIFSGITFGVPDPCNAGSTIVQATNANVYVVHNDSIVLLDDYINGYVGGSIDAFGPKQTATYSESITLDVNDTIDFIVLKSGSYSGGDVVQLEVGIILSQPKAHDPYPASGGTYGSVGGALTLKWESGDYATSGDVYFGKNFADVNQATTTDSRGVYKAHYTPDANGTGSYVAGQVEMGKTYYWRVDDTDSNGIQRGSVWNFTVVVLPKVQWNNASDFSNTQSSNNWEYGYKSSPTDGFTRFPSYGERYYMNMCGWFTGAYDSQCRKNPDNIYRESEFWGSWALSSPLGADLAQKDTGTMPVYRWVAPLDGQYLLDVNFTGIIYGNDQAGTTPASTTSDVYVVKNATIVFQGSINGFAGGNGRASFGSKPKAYFASSVPMQLKSGDTIDFIQGSGGDSGNDLTGVNANIAIVEYIASEPNPSDGATGISGAGTVLTWKKGYSAAATNGHYVYFGTDLASVRDANLANHMGVYRGNQSGISYTTGSLQLSMNYYWRIDETDGSTIWKGQVWRFRTVEQSATDPQPADGSTVQNFGDGLVALSWNPGPFGVQEDLYVGADFNDVNEATKVNPLGVYIGTQTAGHPRSSYGSLPPLNIGETCYWRIDETNGGTVIKGSVWRFNLVAVPDDWNNVKDFGVGTQPSNGWEYGSKSASTGTFTRFPSFGDHFYMNMSGWFVTGAWDSQCRINANESYNESEFWGSWTLSAPHCADLSQTGTGSMPAYRWTAPFNGNYSVKADFAGIIYATDQAGTTPAVTTSDVYVVKNSTAVFTNSINGFVGGNGKPATGTKPTASYSGVLTLNAGDTVDFVQGHGSGTGNDVTSLVATISAPKFIAGKPSPADHSIGITNNIVLSWKAGVHALSVNGHRVYVGQSRNDVLNATPSDPRGVYKGTVSTTSYAVSALPLGQTHYWRIDETDGSTIWKGEVWEFSMVACQASLSGDYNKDSVVNFKDVSILASEWLSTGVNADGNHDGRVDFKDFADLAKNWLVEQLY